MSGHDEAIEAADAAWISSAARGDAGTDKPMRLAVAAFLRAWEPKFGHVWNQVSVKVAANHTAEELEGKV